MEKLERHNIEQCDNRFITHRNSKKKKPEHGIQRNPQTYQAATIKSVDVVLFSRLFDYFFFVLFCSVRGCPSQLSVCNLIILYFDVLALVLSVERALCCIVVSTRQPCQLLSMFPATVSMLSRSFFSLTLFLLYFDIQ